MIKSVQRFTGTVVPSATTPVTITAVVVDKSFVTKPMLMRQNTADESIRFTLADATTVNIENSSGENGTPYTFEVVEFN